MAFGDRFKKFYGKIDPFGGRVFGFDKDDREKFKPEQQYAGGSKEASKNMQQRYVKGAEYGGKTMRAGLDRTNEAADLAGKDYGRARGQAIVEQRQATERAGEERGRALGSAGQMAGVADKEMGQDRQRMLRMADNASRDYQRTADAQLKSSQDSTQRQALAQGSRGGAGGLRAAMAGSLNANQQAATQAQITNAQEQNQLMQTKADMYGKAHDISTNRANVYGNAAGLFTGREDAARSQGIAQQGIEGNAAAGRFGAQAAAGGQETGAGLTTRGQYLGAETGKTAAELNAAREYEGQRQQNEKANYTNDWFPLKKFNAPA
jgi:hypothetical protein